MNKQLIESKCDHPQSRVTMSGKCLDCKRIVRAYDCDCGICNFCNGQSATVAMKPIDMILPCPSCGMLHVDKPEPNVCECGHTRKQHDRFADVVDCCLVGVGKDQEEDPMCPCSRFKIAWDNPPHRKHLCRPADGGCGHLWKPANIATNGVAEL